MLLSVYVHERWVGLRGGWGMGGIFDICNDVLFWDWEGGGGGGVYGVILIRKAL